MKSTFTKIYCILFIIFIFSDSSLSYAEYIKNEVEKAVSDNTFSEIVTNQQDDILSQDNSSSQEDISSQDDILSQDNSSSQEDISSQDNSSSQEDISSQDDILSQDNSSSQEDISSQDDILSQDNSSSQEDISSQDDILSQDNSSSQEDSTLPIPDEVGVNTSEEKFEKILPLNQSEVKESEVFSDRNIIIKYKTGKSAIGKSVTQNVIGKNIASGVSIENYSNLDIGILYLEDENIDIDSVIQEIEKLPHVAYAEKDFLQQPDELIGVNSNDTESINQWYLKSIEAEQAWENYNDTSSKIITTIVDSGVDITHEDLTGNLKDLSNDCKSYTGSVILSGCTNNGWNFESSMYPLFSEEETFDINGHGTHVSGIIGAQKNNTVGIAGVTQNVEMIAARADTYDSLRAGFYVSDTIKAFDFAIENNSKIVNASYGSLYYSQAMYDSIQRLKDHGILLIAAAGNRSEDNDTFPMYPASYDLDNIISVASVGPNDTLASYSNYGKLSVDLAAPGGDITNFNTGEGGILSTTPRQEIVMNESFDSDINYTISGTGTNWYKYNNGQGIHTQGNLYYTGGIDSKLLFNNKFSLTGNTITTVEGIIACDFGSSGYYDEDFGDGLDFYLYDNNSESEDIIYSAFSNYIGEGSYRFSIPINNPLYFKDNLQLGLHFYTDNDDDVGKGCYLDNIKVITHGKNSNSYEYKQGTSMAAPVVSGVAAMIWSYEPSISYQEVKDILLTSVLPLNMENTLVSGGKVDAKKALDEVIKRYGISKSGVFQNQHIFTKDIVLDNKNITLSGATIDVSSTTNSLILENSSNIYGTGNINVPLGSTISSGSGNIWYTPENMDIIMSDSMGNVISSTGQTIYGEGINLSYSGALYPYLYLKTNFGYNAPLLTTQFIPFNTNYSGALIYEIYIPGNEITGILGNISISLLKEVSKPINFHYSTKNFKFDFNPNSVELGQKTNLKVTALGYDGNPIQDYTGSVIFSSQNNNYAVMSGELNSSSYSFNPSDKGIKIFTGALDFTQTGTYTIYGYDSNDTNFLGTGSINILEKSIPIGNVIHTNSGYTNTKSLNLTLLSSEYPVTYVLSGSNNQYITGNLDQAKNIDVLLFGDDGEKDINFILTDLDGNIGNFHKSFTLDTVSPVIVVGSHSQNDVGYNSSIVMTGSIQDDGGVEYIRVSGKEFKVINNLWSANIDLNIGNNIIEYSATDNAGNTSSGSITITRKAKSDGGGGGSISTSSSLPLNTNVSNNTITQTGTIVNGNQQEKISNIHDIQKVFSKESLFIEKNNTTLQAFGIKENTLYSELFGDYKKEFDKLVIAKKDILKGFKIKSKGDLDSEILIYNDIYTDLSLKKDTLNSLGEIKKMKIGEEDFSYIEYSDTSFFKVQSILFGRNKGKTNSIAYYQKIQDLLEKIYILKNTKLDITQEKSLKTEIYKRYKYITSVI